jgi:hypothetical protein
VVAGKAFTGDNLPNSIISMRCVERKIKDRIKPASIGFQPEAGDHVEKSARKRSGLSVNAENAIAKQKSRIERSMRYETHNVGFPGYIFICHYGFG